MATSKRQKRNHFFASFLQHLGAQLELFLSFSLQAHPLFGTIYNSIYFLAKAVESTRKSGKWVMGSSVAENTKDYELEGFSQTVSADEDGETIVPYIILDSDGKGNRLWPTYSVDVAAGTLRYAGHSVHWPRGSRPDSDSNCWFDTVTICTGGECQRGATSFRIASVQLSRCGLTGCNVLLPRLLLLVACIASMLLFS